MLLFKRDYFRGLTGIKNVDTSLSPLKDEDLEIWQREILIERLGTNTYVQLLEHLSDTSGIWFNLIYGTTFQDSNDDYIIYDGLVNKTLKLSPIADYCFVKFCEQNYGNLSFTGEMTVNVEENMPEIYNNKSVQAAQRCISGFIGMDVYIRNMQDLDSDNFPDYYAKRKVQLSTNSQGI